MVMKRGMPDKRGDPCRPPPPLLPLHCRLAGPGTPVYDRLLPASEVVERIEGFYQPYHQALAAELGELQARFGQV